MQTGAHPTASGETIKLFFTAPTDVARLFKAVLATAQRRIERRDGRTASESEALDAMLEHCFETWQCARVRVPAADRVYERDGWRCTVPGCTSYRNLHDHHIQFRSAGGSDELSNRTTLCVAHHLPRSPRWDRQDPRPRSGAAVLRPRHTTRRQPSRLVRAQGGGSRRETRSQKGQRRGASYNARRRLGFGSIRSAATSCNWPETCSSQRSIFVPSFPCDGRAGRGVR